MPGQEFSKNKLPVIQSRPGEKDGIAASLLDICSASGIEAASVDTFLITANRDQRGTKLYKLTVPHLGRNEDLIYQINLRQFNSEHRAYSILVFQNDLPQQDYSRPQETFDRLFCQGWLKPPAPRRNLTFRDLTCLPFISIDSAGVRDDNDRPVYADIDDALFVEETTDGFTCWVAYADITPYSSLVADDPLLLNAQKFGYSVYGASPHIPMLGAEAEALCSLLERQERFAWIIKFDLGSKGSHVAGSEEDFRAKIVNHYQADYDTTFSDNPRSEPAVNLSNIRRAASLLQQFNTPEKAWQVYKLKGETPNAKAVAQFMIHSRRILGQLLIQEGQPAIFRVQNLSPSNEEAQRWIREPNDIGHPASSINFRTPDTLARKLVALFEKNGSLESRIGLTILDLMTGRGCYSLEPLRHDDLGFQPYPETKGLRKLPGFVNQHILDYRYGDLKTAPDISLLTTLCARTNSHRNNNRQINMAATYLQRLISRQRA